MQHYVAEIHFLIQEASVTVLFHHCGQYQLDYEDPEAGPNYVMNQYYKYLAKNIKLKRKNGKCLPELTFLGQTLTFPSIEHQVTEAFL